MTVTAVGSSGSVVVYKHAFPWEGCTIFAISPERTNSVILWLLQSHVWNHAERECFPRTVVEAQ